MKRINIVAWDNGLGLTRHIRLLRRALEAAGHRVSVTAIQYGKSGRRGESFRWFLRRWAIRLSGGDRRGRYDANIMIEHIRPCALAMARVNLFAPHPEWCLPMDVAMLGQADQVLCMTHHAEPVFDARGAATRYIGFTSEDHQDLSVPRERAFFHLAGGSKNKGTELLLSVWRNHPQWPTLTVVQSRKTAQPGAAAANIVHRVDYITDEELQRLQNAHRFHICSSETEGYGHYLVEAMGVGAVVLATDAPPMNEMVTPDRGIRIAWEKTGTQHLATTYYVSERGIVEAVEKALALSEDEAARLGAAARAWFEDNDRQFPARLAAAIEQLG